MTTNKVLLEAKNLKKFFPIKKGILGRSSSIVKAVDGVSLQVYKGETLGIVGESGCGKSTIGRLLIRLLDSTEGEVFYKDQNILGFSKKKLRQLRKDLQIIFQDPYSSLNPRLTVGEIIKEPLVNFKLYGSSQERMNRVEELLGVVGLPKKAVNRFPHEFSGGQRQRIGIARALAVNPELIIADEPVSALDVSIQSQVLNLLKDIQKEFNLTYIFISHDLSVVDHLCDRIAVMYLGKIVEIGSKKEFYKKSFHPYSQALLSAIPQPDPKLKKERIILTGDVPSPSDPPNGCAFHPRCPMSMNVCMEVKPSLIEMEPGRLVSCHLYDSATNNSSTDVEKGITLNN